MFRLVQFEPLQTNNIIIRKAFLWPIFIKCEFPWQFYQIMRVLLSFPLKIITTNNKPRFEIRPACQSWQKKIPPLAWTSATIGFHASTCSFVHIPGVCLYLIYNKEKKKTLMKCNLKVKSQFQLWRSNYYVLTKKCCFELGKIT